VAARPDILVQEGISLFLTMLAQDLKLKFFVGPLMDWTEEVWFTEGEGAKL